MQLLAAQPRFHRFGRVRQVGEHQRRGQHVTRVVLPAETLVEQAGGHVGALEVEVVPHALAQQRIRLRRPRSRGCCGRTMRESARWRCDAHLIDRILLVDIVDAHLGGGGAAHHARTELADAAKEVGHRVIAAFRIDRHVDETRLRLVSVVDETEASSSRIGSASHRKSAYRPLRSPGS